MSDDIVMENNIPAAETPIESKSAFARLRRSLIGKGAIIFSGAFLVVAVLVAFWQYEHTGLKGPRETVSIGLTNDELASLRRLIKPSAPSNPRRGTQLNISQVHDLEERLTALEKAVPLGDSLSAAANNDLRLVQRDIDALRERVVFQGQLIKDQRAELWDQIKVWVGIMVAVNLAILGFFWQIVKSGSEKTRNT